MSGFDRKRHEELLEDVVHSGDWSDTEVVEVLQAALREIDRLESEAKFTEGFTGTLKTLGFDERLMDEYTAQKMKIRTLEATLTHAQEEGTRLVEENRKLKERLGMPTDWSLEQLKKETRE